MHDFSVCKDMKENLTVIKKEGGDNREGGNAFMSNINYQRIEN
jgi:hypothetical protein